MSSTSLLLENGTVLNPGKTPAVLPRHSVLIENGWITRVFPRRKLGRFSGKRIDATGKIIMPGLVNAHTHFYSAFARGLTRTRPADDFVGVLKHLWWRLDSALTLEDCYYSALVQLLEAIRHGTTTLIDHHASPNAVEGSLAIIGKAVEETGLRACLCYEVSDRDGARIARAGLDESAAFIRQCSRRNQPDSSGLSQARPARLAALFGLHAAFTLNDATLARAAELGHELETGFHIHVAEALSDQEHSRRKHGLRVVERLQKFTILGPRSIAAHCVHVNHRELELLAQTRTAVVHNPQSNLNNAVGVADLPAMRQRGVRAGLGTDAMTTHMLEELRVALWAQRLRAQNPSAGFTEVVTALWVNNPAIAQQLFHAPFGEIRAGCVADIAVVDYDPPTPLDSHNVFGHLVFGVSQAAVDSTIVDGRLLMEKKRLTLDLDEPRINARARELARKLWNRL